MAASKQVEINTKTIRSIGVLAITYFGYKWGEEKGDSTAGIMFGTAIGHLAMDIIFD